MDDLSFFLINGSLDVLSITGNLFFAFCLVCPPHGGEGMKQPLTSLLGSLVCYATIYLVSSVADKVFCYSSNTEYPGVCMPVDTIMTYTLPTSMSSSVWLNFYYYTQIVPAQQVLFIWVKRNIKVIIYWALIVDMGFSLFYGVFEVIATIETNNNISVNASFFILDELSNLSVACLSVRIIFLFKFLCVTVGSSWATVSYLRRHMRTMKESGSHFSSPRLTSQMRVTITGILQGILSLFCMLWIIIDAFLQNIMFVLMSIDSNQNVFFTVISLYMFGTTINLGVGQSMFRRRAAGIWLKAQQYVMSIKLRE